MRIKSLSYNALSLICLSFIPTIQCSLLNISIAIINTRTIVGCSSSIDMYESFDPAQIIICPYVFIDKDRIQLINMNIYFDKNNQIKVHLNPAIISLTNLLVKLNNNSFVLASNINPNDTYYLSFSSELTCRFSSLNNETICFYYSLSSNFIDLEYQYDEIKYPTMTLSKKTRHHIYTFFIIITILIIIIISALAIYIVYTNRFSFGHAAESDDIVASKMIKTELGTN
ncbi:unnamed protein product [Rotaria magnacalcarata]|uniref:Uncharacterized protein n=1 Tax=Rotaria magnacalcarata TaxID=392030 RepID=A0A816UPR6_9BILA|nr:unnamed protein product [Rotaria magnacalcarata]